MKRLDFSGLDVELERRCQRIGRQRNDLQAGEYVAGFVLDVSTLSLVGEACGCGLNVNGGELVTSTSMDPSTPGGMSMRDLNREVGDWVGVKRAVHGGV